MLRRSICSLIDVVMQDTPLSSRGSQPLADRFAYLLTSAPTRTHETAIVAGHCMDGARYPSRSCTGDSPFDARDTHVPWAKKVGRDTQPVTP